MCFFLHPMTDLVHVTCSARSDSPKSDIEPYERLLFDEDETNVVLWAMYFNIPSYAQSINSVKMPSNCYVAPGTYFELDYDESIREARKLFTQIYGDVEFLPRAPDPDDIIIEGVNPTDPLPSLMAELNIENPITTDETNNSENHTEQTSTTISNVQNDSQQNTQ